MTQFRSSARAAALLAATALSTPALAETTVTASGWDDLGKMMTDVINPQLTPAAFQFKVPAGADVIRQ